MQQDILKMSKKIIFAGGGTGGHIFPAINIMKYFFKKKYEVVLITDKRGNNFVESYSKFKTYIINTSTPTNKSFLIKFISYFSIIYSIVKSIIILKKEKPDLVFGLGGYVSFPVSFACRFFNLPLVIYENNMVLGRANNYLAPYSKKILFAKKINNLHQKYMYKTCKVGTILSEDIINYSSFGKNDKNIFSILVLGGSQGAEVFGTVIPEVIKKIKDKDYKIEVFHQCLLKQKKILADFYNKNNIKNYVFDFDRNILKLISSSNLAITRCGASTTAELTHTFTPFIAVPLPDSVDNHQYLNGKYYENNGCCWLLEQKNFNAGSLFNIIMDSLTNKNKLENIKLNMKKIYNKDVYSNIENEIKELI